MYSYRRLFGWNNQLTLLTYRCAIIAKLLSVIITIYYITNMPIKGHMTIWTSSSYRQTDAIKLFYYSIAIKTCFGRTTDWRYRICRLFWLFQGPEIKPFWQSKAPGKSMNIFGAFRPLKMPNSGEIKYLKASLFGDFLLLNYISLIGVFRLLNSPKHGFFRSFKTNIFCPFWPKKSHIQMKNSFKKKGLIFSLEAFFDQNET